MHLFKKNSLLVSVALMGMLHVSCTKKRETSSVKYGDKFTPSAPEGRKICTNFKKDLSCYLRLHDLESGEESCKIFEGKLKKRLESLGRQLQNPKSANFESTVQKGIAGHPGLAASEIQAIFLYTTSLYDQANSGLRGDTAQWEESKDLVFCMASGLNKLRKKLPASPTTVYRTERHHKERAAQALANLRTGEMIIEEGFLSTTSNSKNQYGDELPIKFEYVIQSKTGVPIAEFAAYPHEEEVTFLPGTVFKVRDVTKSIPKNIPFLEELYTIHYEEITDKSLIK